MSGEAGLGQEAALTEFTALRAEIMVRQTNQQQLLSIQLTVSGAVFSLALSSPGRSAVLRILPLTTFMLAGRHVAHSYACLSIATYVRTGLSPRVPGISAVAVVGSMIDLASATPSIVSSIQWLGWLAGCAFTVSSAGLTQKVRHDSFLWIGPTPDRE